MATHTIAPGETLSGIGQKYGMDWREIWKANPNVKNPDKIYAGQALSIPDKGASQAPAGSLAKTLPAAVPAAQSPSLPGSTPDLTGNQLPAAGGIGQMGLLRKVLSKLSAHYQASGMKNGLQAVTSGLGPDFAPEKVSGNTMAGIMDFVQRRVREPIQDDAKIFAETIDSIVKTNQETTDNARQLISQAVSGDMWNEMNDAQRKSLWQAAGYVGEPVTAKSNRSTMVAQVNGRSLLIDSNTGETVKDLGVANSEIDNGSTEPKETADQKRVKEFQEDAADLIQQMEAQKINWRTAWDTLHIKYQDMFNKMASPQDATGLIDLTLGIHRRATYDTEL